MALPVVISKLQFEATTPVSTQVVQTTDGEAHYPAAWEQSQVVQSGCGVFLKDTFNSFKTLGNFPSAFLWFYKDSSLPLSASL